MRPTTRLQNCLRAGLLLAAALHPAAPALAQSSGSRTGPPASLEIRIANVGFGNIESTEEDCPGMRRNGQEVLTAKLRLVDADAEGVAYEGSGHFSADIDGCGLTPHREDPGMVHDRGDNVLGDFHGDNFLGCLLTSVVPEHRVRVTLAIDMEDARSPNYVEVEWEPTASPVAVKVRTECERDFDADYRADITESYQNGGDRQITGYDLVRRMVAPGGALRDGVYRDPDDPQWTYTIGEGPEDVAVRIEGPNCACLEGEIAAPKVLDFAARASVRGGTFGRWVVTPEGQPPRELRNDGGATAGLSLGVTKETRRVALAISYTRSGKTYRSEPYPVVVCVTDSVSTPDGAKDISFDDDAPGGASLHASSGALVAGRDVSGEIAWSLEAMNDGTTLMPSEATGAKAQFTYSGLPKANASFGRKKLTVRVEAEGCTCERSAFVRIFFAPFATNHPQPSPLPGGTDAPTQNWFYYWMQTSAAQGVNPPLVLYRRTIAPLNVPPAGAPPPTINGRYEESTDRVLIAGRVPRRGACRARMAKRTPPAGTGVTATGIDCFAETLKHEWQHRVEYLQWWSGGYDRPSDLDGDRVPNRIEEQEPGCSKVNPLSCRGRPFSDATDRELYAYWVGWSWPLGSANAEDWTCLGKQWRGRVCPIPSSLPN